MNPERKEILSLPVLPGRLTPAEAAWRLGFEPDHITVLTSLGLLRPLGHPAASTVTLCATPTAKSSWRQTSPVNLIVKNLMWSLPSRRQCLKPLRRQCITL